MTRPAQADRLQVMNWYEAILSKLAIEFHEEVSQKVENIVAKFPKIARIVYKNARKLPINKFPYNLIYVVDNERKEVKVLAIVHDKRNPSVWQNRVV
jgi:plasmid stabilization system protein ParE